MNWNWNDIATLVFVALPTYAAAYFYGMARGIKKARAYIDLNNELHELRRSTGEDLLRDLEAIEAEQAERATANRKGTR